MSPTLNNPWKVKNDLADDRDMTVLKSCQICGRTFNLSSLERHQTICEKNKKFTSRTVFKSFLQRSRELGIVPIDKEVEKKSKAKCKTLSSGEYLNNGLSPQSSVPVGYQQCPSCYRYFNQKAADRHIAWCQEQKSRLPKTPTNAEALEKLQTRVKYQAPRLRRKTLAEHRLVKSAENVRESSCLRTRSSLPTPQGSPFNKSESSEHNNLKSISFSVSSNNNSEEHISKISAQEFENKKTGKFEDKLPTDCKDRNKNLDILRALRLHLSQLSTSEEHSDDYIIKPLKPEDRIENSHAEDVTSVGDSLSNKIENTEKRLPRFCYNCGTKYPIVSAKYCCECGVQRFIFKIPDQEISFTDGLPV